MDVTFFKTPSTFRKWLQRHHSAKNELWVGFYKVGSGHQSITWPESVDEALCVGWIDGVRKRIDDGAYAIRFSPRKPGSSWSTKNIRRMHELIAQGRANDAGIAAFEARRENRSGVYSYESRPTEFEDRYALRFRSNTRAWEYFHEQPPSYRRAAIWWVVSARREETRERRFAALIDDSAAGRRIAPLRRQGKSHGDD